MLSMDLHLGLAYQISIRAEFSLGFLLAKGMKTTLSSSLSLSSLLLSHCVPVHAGALPGRSSPTLKVPSGARPCRHALCVFSPTACWLTWLSINCIVQSAEWNLIHGEQVPQSGINHLSLEGIRFIHPSSSRELFFVSLSIHKLASIDCCCCSCRYDHHHRHHTLIEISRESFRLQIGRLTSTLFLRLTWQLIRAS